MLGLISIGLGLLGGGRSESGGGLFVGIDDMLGIGCMTSEFPPDKAKAETQAVIQKVLQDKNVDGILASGNASLIEQTFNNVFKLLASGKQARASNIPGSADCTKVGETLASKMYGNAINTLKESLSNRK